MLPAGWAKSRLGGMTPSLQKFDSHHHTSMDSYEFEEEDFQSQLSGKTIRRMFTLALPHRMWLIGFVVLIAVVAAEDGVFNFLKKQIIDAGITPGDTAALTRIIIIYGAIALTQAAGVFGFIYLAGILGERI